MTKQSCSGEDSGLASLLFQWFCWLLGEWFPGLALRGSWHLRLNSFSGALARTSLEPLAKQNEHRYDGGRLDV